MRLGLVLWLFCVRPVTTSFVIAVTRFGEVEGGKSVRYGVVGQKTHAQGHAHPRDWNTQYEGQR